MMNKSKAAGLALTRIVTEMIRLMKILAWNGWQCCVIWLWWQGGSLMIGSTVFCY